MLCCKCFLDGVSVLFQLLLFPVNPVASLFVHSSFILNRRAEFLAEIWFHMPA